MQLLIIYSITLLLREGTDNNKGSCVVHRRMLLLPRGQRESGVEIVYYELMKSIFNEKKQYTDDAIYITGYERLSL